jgi:hypothetical protein
MNGTSVHLGIFVTEEGAARAYDRMAVWCKLNGLEDKKGPGGKVGHSLIEDLNFDYVEYEGEVEELGCMTQAEVVAGASTRAHFSST